MPGGRDCGRSTCHMALVYVRRLLAFRCRLGSHCAPPLPFSGRHFERPSVLDRDRRPMAGPALLFTVLSITSSNMRLARTILLSISMLVLTAPLAYSHSELGHAHVGNVEISDSTDRGPRDWDELLRAWE